MSSVQAFPLNLYPETTSSDDISKYVTAGTGITLNAESGKHAFNVSGSNRVVTLNDAAKTKLYPNTSATPTSCQITMTIARLGWIGTYSTAVKFNGTQVCSFSRASSDWLDVDSGILTSSAITTSKRDANIEIVSSAGLTGGTTITASFTLYFTRYDFSATAGTGISSATASQSMGYDGDTITFTASLQSGYTFDGWYNGSTKVSSSQTYVHTVAGADMALTAKAIASTKTVTTKYGNTTIATEQRMPPVAVSYGSTQIVSISSGQTKTLPCANNLMSSNLTVGGKTLLCADKIMSGNIIVSVS